MALIPGTTGNDTLEGTIDADTLNGLGGADTLFGSAGADEMNGGLGTDTVDYSGSDAAVLVDLPFGFGDFGHATGDTYSGIENAVGSAFDDFLVGDGAANRLDGGDGADSLIGGLGADTLIGGAGIDTIGYEFSAAAVTVNLTTGAGLGGEAQADVLSGIENLNGSAFNDVLAGDGLDNVLTGLAGDDTLSGSAGNDVLSGGDDDDLLLGGLGNDTIDGGTGVNTVDYAAASAFVKVNLTTGLTSGAHGIDTLTNVQNIIGSEFGDSLTGNGGDNTIVGSTGADTMAGGLGIDTADYSSAGGAVIVNLTLGTGRNSVAEGDRLSGFENVTGSDFNDSLTGDLGDNLLTGLEGNDSLLGGAGNDTMDGGLGERDSLTGGTGDDTYFVDSTTDRVSESTNSGTDQVFATATYTLSLNVENLTLTGSDDIIGTGNSAANILIGNTGNNALDGGANNDHLDGGDGNDTLTGGTGFDTMAGEDGDDTYFVDSLLDVITEVASEGHDTVNSSVTWVLDTPFEDLTLIGSTGAAGTGNAFGNVINGNIGSNLLQGLGGADSIVGDLTDDTLRGGNDTLDGGTGADTLVGGLGNDTYLINFELDSVVENADGGTDVVLSALSYALGQNIENLVLSGTDDLFGIGNTQNNVITGNDGSNLLDGDLGDDTLFGGIGNDTLDGFVGADSMVGGVGDDQYIVDSIADNTIEGAGGGMDSVTTLVSYTLASNVENLTAVDIGAMDLTGNTLDNLITGNSFANLITGGSGDDTLDAGDGDDTLVGGVGVDQMSGGAGNDAYFVDTALDTTVELTGQGLDTVTSTINWTLADFTENLVLVGTAGLIGTGNDRANTITGTAAANLLSGLVGADTLNGDAGNDSLDGGNGIDLMVGGTGDDTYTLGVADDVAVELVGEGNDTIQTAFSYTLLDNFERLVLTGTANLDGTGNAAANIITGTAGNNVLTGLDGDDTLNSGGGDDTLDGGVGADSLAGGAGADLYLVDDVGDKVVETSSKQIDTVISSVSFVLGTNVENLELAIGATDGTGNSVANLITGNLANNLLIGSGGNDTLLGGAGADTLNGGIGNDSMVGGNGSDTYVVNATTDIVVELGTGIDTVESAVTFTLDTTLENLTLTGTLRVNATGNAGDNVIIGNSGINKLTGMLGNDTLTGGDGADRFVFNSIADGLDTITDFNGLVSGLADGDALQFAASLLVGPFAYIGAAGFSGLDTTEARITANGRVIMDFDGDGTGDLTIIMTGLLTEDQLTADNFAFL